MLLFLPLALLFLSGMPDFTVFGSTLKPFHDMNMKEAIMYLYEKFLSLENRETPDLTQKIKGEIRDELMAKLAEMEVSFVNKHNDLSTKQQELEENASKQKESLNELSERFMKEKNERLTMDNRILMEVHQLQRRALETVEKINTLKNEVTSAFEGGRNKTDMLEVKINETNYLAHSCVASLRDTEVAVRKNISSSAEVLETMTNHTSEISSIDTRLSRVENACGLDSRNVGGNSSSGAPSRPWMATVFWKGESLVQCTGSIIHRKFIVTVADCVYKFDTNGVPKQLDATDLTVRLGLTDTVDLTHLQDHNVRTIHVHPLYNRSNYWDYAIALLELEKPIDYDLFVGPVCLPPRETPEDNRVYEPQSSVHAIGWDGYGSNRILREYPAVIQPRDICERRILEASGPNLTDGVFCADPSGADDCLYAPGSAAVQSRPDGRGGLVWTQVGVGGYCLRDSSSSSGSGVYYLFHRLQQLVPWIEEAVGGAAP